MRCEFVDPSLAHPLDIAEGPFVYHPPDLRVAFGRRIHNEQMPAADVAARGPAVGKLAGEVTPHDVEALHDAILWKRGSLAHHRGAALASGAKTRAAFRG